MKKKSKAKKKKQGKPFETLADSVAGLSQAQIKSAQVYASTGSLNGAAEVSCVVKSTVWKWLQKQEFRAYVNKVNAQFSRDLMQGFIARKEKILKAYDFALGVKKTELIPAATINLRAASLLSDKILQYVELVDFTDRLLKLEEAEEKDAPTDWNHRPVAEKQSDSIAQAEQGCDAPVSE